MITSISDAIRVISEDVDIANKPPETTLLVVAMSGGVDSSTVAALLSLAGYKVIGVTLNLYSGDDQATSCKSKSCCGSRDISDAKAVASRFNFPHYVLDYRERFRGAVIDKFVKSYQAGKTPVPCILCNQTVKFDDLLNLARSLEADALITGHYVRRKKSGNRPIMLEAADDSKDQSYFLGFTTCEQLDFIRFPLGNFFKTQIRDMAKNLEMKVHDKPDSQDICFVGGYDNYRDFILQSSPDMKKSGPITDRLGNVIGRHDGVYNFTIGQRRGIASSMYHGEPLYVLEIDTTTNKVIVGPKSELMVSKVAIEDMNWISEPTTTSVEVRLRSSADKTPATIVKSTEKEAQLELLSPYFAIAPGQACVIYDGPVVLGSGIIT